MLRVVTGARYSVSFKVKMGKELKEKGWDHGGGGRGEKPMQLANEGDWGLSKACFQLSAGDRSQTPSDRGGSGRGVRTACQLLFGVVLR